MAHNIQTEIVDDEFRHRLGILATIASGLFPELSEDQRKWTRMLEQLRSEGGREEGEVADGKGYYGSERHVSLKNL